MLTLACACVCARVGEVVQSGYFYYTVVTHCTLRSLPLLTLAGV